MEEQLELFPVDYPAQPDTALDTAKKIIYGDREKTYGRPDKNLQATANLWFHYLYAKCGGDFSDFDIDAKDVCVMMALLKTARFANDPNHKDNVVDAIGYWALVERCDETPKGRP